MSAATASKTRKRPSRSRSAHTGPQNASEGPLLLSADQAAELLGLRRSTLDAYARAGTVPSVFVGRHRRYRLAELNAYVTAL